MINLVQIIKSKKIVNIFFIAIFTFFILIINNQELGLFYDGSVFKYLYKNSRFGIPVSQILTLGRLLILAKFH